MRILFIFCFFLWCNLCLAQGYVANETHDVLVVKLINKAGGHFAGQDVTIKTTNGAKVAFGKSDGEGIFSALLPAGSEYVIWISNYPEQQVVKLPAGGFAKKTISIIYEADAIQKQKEWALTPKQEKQINDWAIALPSTSTFNTTEYAKLKPTDFQILYSLSVSDLKNGPLAGENVTIYGIRRKKAFRAVTDPMGNIKMLLPKGDKYVLHFTYDSAFSLFEVAYSMGTATRDFTLQYIGTREIEKRKKEEAERLKAEEERLKKEIAEFDAYVKKHGITPEEGRRREMLLHDIKNYEDTVILTVFNRNPKWIDKLIVCDVTGSMSPYYGQLVTWYGLRYKLEKNLQFVFFNDKPETGGIHYFPAKGYDSLIRDLSWCAAEYGGGDGPENNMAALTRAIKLSKPYKELIMIADNYAPIKDKLLYKNYKTPVHIILCGARSGIHPDYLELAWKTGGTVHTMEEDITKISSLLDGETLQIGKFKYRLSGGKFYKVDEM